MLRFHSNTQNIKEMQNKLKRMKDKMKEDPNKKRERERRTSHAVRSNRKK